MIPIIDRWSAGDLRSNQTGFSGRSPLFLAEFARWDDAMPRGMDFFILIE